MAISPRLMRWMITKLAGRLAALRSGRRAPRVEEAGHGVGRPLGRDRHHLVVHDELVEVAEVLVHLVVGHGRAGLEQPDLLDDAAVAGRVALDDHRPDHVAEEVDLVGVKCLTRPKSRKVTRPPGWNR